MALGPARTRTADSRGGVGWEETFEVQVAERDRLSSGEMGGRGEERKLAGRIEWIAVALGVVLIAWRGNVFVGILAAVVLVALGRAVTGA